MCICAPACSQLFFHEAVALVMVTMAHVFFFSVDIKYIL